MTDIELITYLVMFALSVIFSTFTIDRKSVTFSFLSMLTWYFLAICHASLASATGFIFFAYLFVGLGLVYMVYGFALVISTLAMRKRQAEWELP